MYRKKNICFLLGGFSAGGIGRVTSILANEISNDEIYNIHLLTIAVPNKPEIYYLDSSITRESLLKEYTSMRKSFLLCLRKLKKYISKHNIDILIACGNVFYLPAMASAIFSKTMVICWEHSNIYNTHDNSGQTLNRYMASKFANQIVTLTDCDKSGFISRLNAKRIIRIYNPIDPVLSESEPIYDDGIKKILSVGRLSYQKQFEIIPELAKNVFKNHPDWIWDIYGSGEQFKLLQSIINKNGLTNKINLKGQIKDMYKKYSEYSMIVMTSRYEGFPMTLLEASANSLPMISFDIETGPNEIIEDGVNGFLVKPFDIKLMSNKIAELIENPVLRVSMSKNSYNTSKKFNAETIKKQWYKLFDLLLSEQ